jgi:hypothetical protein
MRGGHSTGAIGKITHTHAAISITQCAQLSAIEAASRYQDDRHLARRMAKPTILATAQNAS